MESLATLRPGAAVLVVIQGKWSFATFVRRPYRNPGTTEQLQLASPDGARHSARPHDILLPGEITDDET